jgi:hypothetical protein
VQSACRPHSVTTAHTLLGGTQAVGTDISPDEPIRLECRRFAGELDRYLLAKFRPWQRSSSSKLNSRQITHIADDGSSNAYHFYRPFSRSTHRTGRRGGRNTWSRLMARGVPDSYPSRSRRLSVPSCTVGDSHESDATISLAGAAVRCMARDVRDAASLDADRRQGATSVNPVA